MPVIAINTDGQIVDQKHITFFAKEVDIGGDEYMIIYEVVENFYIHPDTMENYLNDKPYALIQQTEVIERTRITNSDAKSIALRDAGKLNEYTVNVIRGLMKQ